MEGEIISAFIGIIVGAIFSYATLRYNYRGLFAKTVSESRNNWINTWREAISEFISTLDFLIKYKNIIKEENEHQKIAVSEHNINNECELLQKLYKNKYLIVSRLNLNEVLHQNIFVLIESLADYEKYYSDKKKYDAEKLLLLELVRNALKIEWERVKKEAGGGGFYE